MEYSVELITESFQLILTGCYSEFLTVFSNFRIISSSCAAGKYYHSFSKRQTYDAVHL